MPQPGTSEAAEGVVRVLAEVLASPSVLPSVCSSPFLAALNSESERRPVGAWGGAAELELHERRGVIATWLSNAMVLAVARPSPSDVGSVVGPGGVGLWWGGAIRRAEARKGWRIAARPQVVPSRGVRPREGTVWRGHDRRGHGAGTVWRGPVPCHGLCGCWCAVAHPAS